MGIEFPERRMVAMVTRSERIEPHPFGRTSFEFDAIDAETPLEELDAVLSNPDIRKPFAAVRVVTTENRFDELFGFVPTEGTWVELELSPDEKRELPLAFHSPLEEGGYERYTVGRLSNSRLLSEIGEVPRSPSPLGASVAQTIMLAQHLKAKCAFPASSIAPASEICVELWPLILADRLVVRDVGQASFVSFRNKEFGDVDLGHFDAGWPISYNHRTAPSSVPILSTSVPVILSHWDWDHLHGYYKSDALRNSPWITPVQNLGPGAFKVATALAKRKLLLGCGSSITFGPLDIIVCSGPHPMNDTGLAVVITLLSGKRALLVGDASYASLGPPWTSVAFDLLVVTHHGADFDGPAPIANGKGLPAAVSVGKGNVYKHPRQQALKTHRAASWKLQLTSRYGTHPRGDRVLS